MASNQYGDMRQIYISTQYSVFKTEKHILPVETTTGGYETQMFNIKIGKLYGKDETTCISRRFKV